MFCHRKKKLGIGISSLILVIFAYACSAAKPNEPPANSESLSSESPSQESSSQNANDLSEEEQTIPAPDVYDDPFWLMQNHNRSRTAWNENEDMLSPPLEMAWTITIPDFFVDGITVTDDKIFLSGMNFVNEQSQVYVMDSSGDFQWSYTLSPGSGGAMGASPVYHHGSVFFGGQSDDNLYAADSATGEILWTHPGMNSLYASNLVVSNDVVYSFGSDSKLFAVQSSSGELLWSVDADGFGGKTAISGDVLVASSYFTPPFALDPGTGEILWSRTDLSEMIYSEIIAFDGVVYLGNKTNILALDIHDGKTIWSKPVPIDSSEEGPTYYRLALANGTLFASGGIQASYENSQFQPQNILIALDSGTGAILWQTAIHSNWGNLVVANDVVYTSTIENPASDGAVVALDVIDGKEIWRWQPEGLFYPEIVVADNSLFVGYVQIDGFSIFTVFNNPQ